MARYKDTHPEQDRLLPIRFSRQILPGTFEFALNELIDNAIDLTVFDSRYKNDDTGAPAYHPGILLKVILYGYSRGLLSSRDIERSCRENIIFMALSADSQPHFTTIGSFIRQMKREIGVVFRDVLLVCDKNGLIGRDMFAIDGVKLPGNASKSWSGTKEEFRQKGEKLEKAIAHLLEKHQANDDAGVESPYRVREEKQIEKLQADLAKLKEWMAKHDDKIGPSGKVRKSNVTDPDSAKMKTSKGVIQGYVGVAAVDSKHQVIVHAEAHGAPQEQELLIPFLDNLREGFHDLGDPNILRKAAITADAGYHSEANLTHLAENDVDALIADNQFRKRDPRFTDAGKHKPAPKKADGQFSPDEFEYDEKPLRCHCPAGYQLYLKHTNAKFGNYRATVFMGRKAECGNCVHKARCLKDPKQKTPRQVAFFHGRDERSEKTQTQRMKEKIDSERGRADYGRRIATVEPVFGNIRTCKGMDRFTLRGREKVESQWLMYCVVHNIEKLHRSGYGARR